MGGEEGCLGRDGHVCTAHRELIRVAPPLEHKALPVLLGYYSSPYLCTVNVASSRIRVTIAENRCTASFICTLILRLNLLLLFFPKKFFYFLQFLFRPTATTTGICDLGTHTLTGTARQINQRPAKVISCDV